MNKILNLIFYLCDPTRRKHKRAAKLLAKRRANPEMNTESILRSAQRLAEGEREYREKGNHHWLFFIKRESTILLRRAVKLWLRLRLGRAK